MSVSFPSIDPEWLRRRLGILYGQLKTEQTDWEDLEFRITLDECPAASAYVTGKLATYLLSTKPKFQDYRLSYWGLFGTLSEESSLPSRFMSSSRTSLDYGWMQMKYWLAEQSTRTNIIRNPLLGSSTLCV